MSYDIDISSLSTVIDMQVLDFQCITLDFGRVAGCHIAPLPGRLVGS